VGSRDSQGRMHKKFSEREQDGLRAESLESEKAQEGI
jgi:hypothetical protein